MIGMPFHSVSDFSAESKATGCPTVRASKVSASAVGVYSGVAVGASAEVKERNKGRRLIEVKPATIAMTMPACNQPDHFLSAEVALGASHLLNKYQKATITTKSSTP